MRTIDLIVPIYNEEISLQNFVEEVIKIQGHIDSEVKLRVLFVDDGSTDNSWNEVMKISTKLSDTISIAGLRLSRNYGKESALYAGIVNSSADAMIPIDVDLQDPPALIPDFVDAWVSGARMVVAYRSNRIGDGVFKRKSAEYFYKIFNAISDIQIPNNVGDFRLIDRTVARDITRITESNKFMKGIFSYVAKPDAEIPFVREIGLRSKQNQPTQNFGKLLNLAELALTSAGPKLFRKLLAFLIVFDTALIFYGLFVLFLKFVSGEPFEGFASIILLIILTSSVQLTLLTIFGLIISRVYLESKNRPSYFVREEVNLS